MEIQTPETRGHASCAATWPVSSGDGEKDESVFFGFRDSLKWTLWTPRLRKSARWDGWLF